MFKRQKSPIVTASYCREMEDVRMALEVMFGQSLRFHHIDFNTGRAAARLGDEEKSFSFFFGDRIDLLRFSIWNEAGEPKEWYSALFEKLENGLEVRVIKDSDNTHKRGEWDMWWVGRSATDRWEEPLCLRQAEHCAQMRGLSLEAFLRLEAGETWPLEAKVVVGGIGLSQAQSMAVRVAVNDMLTDMQDPEQREELGEIAEAYEDRLREVGYIFLQKMAKQ